MQAMKQCSFCGAQVDYQPKTIMIRGAQPPACIDCYIAAESMLFNNQELAEMDKQIRDAYRAARQLESQQDALRRSKEDQFRDAMKARRTNGIQESRTPESQT